MINKKSLSFFIILIFIFNIFIPISSASNQDFDQDDYLDILSTDDESSNYNRLIDRLAIKIYSIPYVLAEKKVIKPQMLARYFKWFIFILNEPPLFSSEPKSIDIKYLNNSFIDIGLEDKEGNWRTDFPGWPFADYEYFKFKLDIPEEIPKGSIKYRFLPTNQLEPEKGKQMKVSLNIETYFPDDFEIPDQFTIRVNVTRYQIINNIYRNAWDQYYKGSSIGPILFLISLPSWIALRDIQGVITQNVYIDLVVRESRSHLLEILPNVKKHTISPDTLKDIPIKIRNLGSHKDTFNFKVFTDNNEDIMLSAPNSVSLEAFEEKTVYVSLATPRFFNDPGTLHDIKIQAHSIYDPDLKFNNSVAVVTEGLYISEGFMYSSVPILIFVVVIIYLLYLRRKRQMEKLLKKPEKPWNLPMEEKHLEKLKKKDKEKYEKELEMMKDEYNSALLWYKSYRDFILSKKVEKIKPKLKKVKTKPKKKKKQKPERGILKGLFKKEKPKEIKPKPKKIKKKIEKKPEKPQPKKVTREKKPSKRKSKKEKIIERIKREQEKQKLKLGD